MTVGRRLMAAGSGLGVHSRVILVLSVMGFLVVVGAAVTSVLLDRTTRATRQLVEQVEPSRAEAFRLQTALVDQESGMRGYAITADRRFLEPYQRGLAAERQSTLRLAALVKGDDGLTADLEALRRAADAWRGTYAEPLLAAVEPGSPKEQDKAIELRGKQAFDQIRALSGRQNRDLQAASDAGKAELLDAQRTRDQVLAGMLAAFLLTGVALAVLLQRTVARPLRTLAAAARHVASGDFDHHIPVRGPGDIRAVAGDVESMREHIVAELVTARRQRAELDERARELARSNADLEQFAYVASHDLQEPLRKVASFCQILEQRYAGKLDERGVQYIHFAVDGAKRMQSLINDLLTFSRVGRPKDTHRQRLSLDLPLDAALDNLTAALEDTGAVVERPQALPEVSGDLTQLTMLWQNLVSNAIKFRHPDRPATVRITCAAWSESGPPAWEIRVADNGIGIERQYADRVFVIFQRLHTRDAYPGTGIGLALCKKIVEYHGGRIWIASDRTEGTTLCFTLPHAVTKPD
ncbi:sensor histidine kinase [Nonomuraea rhizosphaerae]|uniref:sensor histidine kinase n=1 Tax=Nonomuraea rhizosphaerae TaxID=2665663 RepID=UPI001FEAEFF0|nr:sensor histidine kinase [Nonomuraea rhizosphaerae]